MAMPVSSIMVKVRDNHVVQNRPAYLAVGIDADGEKHVLGIWLAKTPPEAATAGEAARFWNSVMTDLRNRGVRVSASGHGLVVGVAYFPARLLLRTCSSWTR